MCTKYSVKDTIHMYMKYHTSFNINIISYGFYTLLTITNNIIIIVIFIIITIIVIFTTSCNI